MDDRRTSPAPLPAPSPRFALGDRPPVEKFATIAEIAPGEKCWIPVDFIGWRSNESFGVDLQGWAARDWEALVSLYSWRTGVKDRPRAVRWATRNFAELSVQHGGANGEPQRSVRVTKGGRQPWQDSVPGADADALAPLQSLREHSNLLRRLRGHSGPREPYAAPIPKASTDWMASISPMGELGL